MFLHDSVDMCRNRKWTQTGSGSFLLPGFLTWSLKMLKLSHESLEALLCGRSWSAKTERNEADNRI